MSSDHSNSKMENPENEVSSSQAPESGEQPNHEESRLLKVMNYAISKQNAAFCCGGQVPIVAIADEGEEHRFDDVAGMITSPPVVLRWDLPSGMYSTYHAKHLFFVTASHLNLSREARSMSNGFPGLQECHAY